MKRFLFLLLIAIGTVQAETKFLIFATEAEARAKELELRNATNCANPATKTNKYAEVIVNKDGTAILPIEPVYNHSTKQTVDVANTVLQPAEKTALVTKDDATVKASIEYDTTAKATEEKTDKP
jgi:hypothetical protein